MSAYTTLTFTREAAIRALMHEIEGMSNEKLSDLLDFAIEYRLYNAIVVPDESFLPVDYK